MNRIKRLLPLLLLLGLLLTACGGGDEAGNSDAVLTQAAQIAMEGLTQTAAAAPPTATDTPEPTATNTPEPTATFTSTPEVEVQEQPTQAPAQNNNTSSNTPCWRGNLEYENIPDGTIFYQDKTVEKTWRIKNTGTCTWPADTVAIFIEGDLMGSDGVIAATDKEVPPNDYIEVNATFISPHELGDYKGYWMLRGSDAIWGIGPTGYSWFWIDIEVQRDPN